MNKNAIQRFAIWARKELISQVSQRAYQYDITADGYGDYDAEAVGGRLLSDDEKKQRQQLISQIRSKGYTQVMEEIAYTWFNRFIALRFMEVNNYLPTHIRVFSDASGAFKPEILRDALHLDLDGLDMEKVSDLIEKNQSEDLYRYLLLTQCNALSASLPRMFENMGSYTELLLPNNILSQDGVLGRMVTEIPEEDWTDQVQIIGWLYQYYNTEPKDDTFALLKKNVKITKERIPSATQLFTPDWIVRYMVENSLGRLWIEGHPDDELKARWKYYLDEAEQDADVQAQLEAIRAEYRTLRPQDIKVIDPCMGSGHILVYAFDVLVQIYKKAGFSERDAAQSILENNLYGLDIDDRAAQLAYFAVMMKARQYDRRIFTRNIQPHVYAIVDSGWTGGAYQLNMGNFLLSKEHQETLNYLLDVFRDAKEYGSILKLEDRDYQGLKRAWTYTASETAENVNMLLWYSAVEMIVPQLIEQAIILTQKYDVVVTNPPYMAVSNASAKMQDYVKKNFPDSKADLFAVFIERCRMLTKSNGYQAMITQHAWMFLSSFENLRNKLQAMDIINLIHLGIGTFEDLNSKVVQSVAFVFHYAKIKGYAGVYHRLFEKQGLQESKEDKQQWLLSGKHRFVAQQDNFSKIPGSPVAYWVSEKFIEAFEKNKLEDYVVAVKGLDTCDNDTFVRAWHEVDFNDISFDISSTNQTYSHKWFPYCKGGGYSKWYGFMEKVVNWENDGEILRNLRNSDGKIKSRPQNTKYYFKEGLTWSTITSYKLSLRYMNHCIFGGGGSAMFAADADNMFYCLGFINSCVTEYALSVLNPTLNFLVGDILSLPIIFDYTKNQCIESMVTDNITKSKVDWDSFETSWDFQIHPLVRWSRELFDATSIGTMMAHYYGGHPKANCSLELCFMLWQGECEERFQTLKSNEEELNRIFLDIYGLQGELPTEVEDRDVTVRRADLGRDIRSLISYAVGCMFGRYSLDIPGLAYAGGEWDDAKYNSFLPDKDNIIPICDDEYFDDDITGRFVRWVEVVFNKESLEENLKYIANALVGKGTPREVIRNYFLNDFYADHLRTYQKRPIYWLFDSGKKNGFKALIYMHRYQSDLLARMRTDYVHEQQERYRTQLKHIGDAMDSASASERIKLSKQQKKLQEQALELQKYEEKIHHLADQNIKIDLDDGVVHNYELFTDVLAKRK